MTESENILYGQMTILLWNLEQFCTNYTEPRVFSVEFTLAKVSFT